MNLEKTKILIYKYPFLKKLLYSAILIRRYFLQIKFHWQEEIYQNLCAILVESLVIKVNEFQGIFVLNCHSDLFKTLLMTKHYEPQLAKYCLRYLNKDRDVIDIGANVGFYTVLFAKNLNSKRVLSIEPTNGALKYLYKNIQLNKISDKVIVFEGVVSNKPGEAKIKILEGKEEYSTLGKWNHPSISREKYFLQSVRVETIDNLVMQYSLEPGFLKVDVEGFEHLVFEGSKKVLENYRPLILSELSNPLLKENGSSSAEVLDLIKRYNYEVIDVIYPDISPATRDFTNILCIPRELGFKR